MKHGPVGDGWYDSEESTRLAMITELQRIKRRMLVRPLPVLLLAVLITSAVTYKVATKPHVYRARVVLALNEGMMSSNQAHSIPFDQLKDYVSSVLLPDAKLLEILKQRNARRIERLGEQLALQDFRETIEIEIWKNSFVFYSDDESSAKKSARIGIDVSDVDADQAYDVAHDLATIIIKTHDEERRKVAVALTKEVAAIRDGVEAKLDALSASVTATQAAFDDARRRQKSELAATLYVELMQLEREQKRASALASQIAASPEGSAESVTAAGLDLTLSVVDERRPERPEQSGLVIAMLVAIIGTGALIGSALVLGAFDGRVHDTDDVTRLGLPVLGHVPGFPGDHVGSLKARGAARARVPSFLRWR